MSSHPRIEAWLHRVWSHRGPTACLLYPLSLIYEAISASKRKSTKPQHLPVPVVVVGNIYVGGTGKTPVTIALVRELRARGWTPGVISRGFGRQAEEVKIVTPESDAREVGDEPLLIARDSMAPVAVGRARYQAGLALLHAHPGVNIILSDDGLQHTALARDVELAVIGAGGLGNGWLLPAGPLLTVRLVSPAAEQLIILPGIGVDRLRRRHPVLGACRRLSNGDIRDIDEISHDLKASQGKALAAAGIASPGRFFAMVRAHDIDCTELELGDHYNFAKNPFAGRKESIILITAKDAVKCARIPEIKNDDRIWVVGLAVVLDTYLVDIVDQKAAAAAQRMGRHPETRNDKIE